MSSKLPSEKEAREQVKQLEKHTAVKLSRRQRQDAIKRLMGKKRWFE